MPVRGNCEGEAAERTKRVSIRIIYSAMTRRASAIRAGSCRCARTAAGLWLGFRPFDDTYITFRYSLNLASGHGFVYNLGEPVLGTTTPLWALALALFAALGAPVEQTSLRCRSPAMRRRHSCCSGFSAPSDSAQVFRWPPLVCFSASSTIFACPVWNGVVFLCVSGTGNAHSSRAPRRYCECVCRSRRADAARRGACSSCCSWRRCGTTGL